MTEEFKTPDNSDVEYGETELKNDVDKWVKSRTWVDYSGWSDLDLFIDYSNNFWTNVRDAFSKLNEDGSLKEKEGEKQSDREFRESLAFEFRHLNVVQEVIRDLGFDPQEMRKFEPPFNDDQKEKIKTIWIGMISRGFTWEDLKG